MSNEYRVLIHSKSKSKYDGGFKQQNGRMNNTSEYNHNYYESNKDKWDVDDENDDEVKVVKKIKGYELEKQLGVSLKSGKGKSSTQAAKATKVAREKGVITDKQEIRKYNGEWQIVEYSNEKEKSSVGHSYVTVYNDELYHFGVPGMKWGIKKNPERAYHKAVNRLARYEARAQRGLARASERNRYRQARMLRRATKFNLKSSKIRARASRKFMPMNAEKAAAKQIKYDRKAALYADRAAKMQKKITKGQAKYEKNMRKGQKLYSKMQKNFQNVPASSLNPKDIARGAQLAKRFGA